MIGYTDMKTKELKDKKAQELAKLLKEKRDALRQFHFDITGSKVRNVRLGRSLRKEIAQLMTAMKTATK